MKKLIVTMTLIATVIGAGFFFTGSEKEKIEVITFTEPVEISVPVREVTMAEEVIDVPVTVVAMNPIEITSGKLSVAEKDKKDKEKDKS
ncbi:MAG: hypothetical protein R6W70_03100 [bacterium]